MRTGSALHRVSVLLTSAVTVPGSARQALHERPASAGVLGLLPLLLAISCSGDLPTVTGPTAASVATVVAAGDIGVCGSSAALATGRLLDEIPGFVLALGDLAYESGTAQQFATCYEAAWGRHKPRTYPAPGNHEYESAGALPYFDYFGPRAGPRGLGYYSFRAGDWLVLSLNSNVPGDLGSAQGQWLRAELGASSARCTLAYFHYPLVSSGPNGDNPSVRGLWQILYDARADVVLSGHDHLYERFAPLRPDGQRDDVRGLRLFISGGGGAHLYTARRVHAGSETIISTHGVLTLTLGRDHYDWEFVQIGGARLDAGAGVCH